MKIGLITFHDTTNFGSLLQTYGLYKKVQELGYNIDVIDYQCESIVRREVPQKFNLLQSPRGIMKDILIGSVIRLKYKELSKFLHEKMSLSARCDKYSIVGSDIVWGMDIIDGDLTYFLNFESESHKKIAFSSSIGNPWKEEDKKRLKPLLSDFSSIAVREDESADWVEELTGKRPNVVCDPTMLIDSEAWLKCTYPRKDKGSYVLVYFDNKNGDCINSAIKYAQANNLKVKYINYGLPKKGVQNVKPISLEDFLSLINDAAKVITASYHGNRAHKSRMNTLARKLQVQNCDGEGKDILNMPKVNYEEVNKAVEEYRDYSVTCLKKMLAL